MTTTTAERFTETVGPIVVKEVRQGLRARVFAIFFGVLLVACFTMALVAFADASGGLGSTTGREFFAAYLTALGGVCFFVIPFVAFRSMVRELEDETWVLLMLTGLGPQSITRGKWVSALSQSLLFASACAPFVLFSYFLNGVDIIQLVAGLMLASAWSALLTAVGLAIATQAHSKLGRAIAHFVVLGVLGAGTAMGIGFAWLLAEEGHRLGTNDAFRNVMVGLSVFSVALTWLVLECASAGLASPTDAASRGPRKALLGVTTLGLLFGLAVYVTQNGRGRDAVAGQVLVCMFLALCGVFASSERDGWPKQVTLRGWLKPGAERSFWLVAVLLLVSTLMWGGLWLAGAGSREKELRGILGACFYPLLYMSLGVLAGRLTPLKQLGEPRATRVGFVASVVLGTVISCVVALIVEGRADGRISNALNPLVGMANCLDRSGDDMDIAIVVCGASTLLATFLAALTLRARNTVRA